MNHKACSQENQLSKLFTFSHTLIEVSRETSLIDLIASVLKDQKTNAKKLQEGTDLLKY